MPMTSSRHGCLLVLLAVAGSGVCAPVAGKAPQHVLFFLVDDLGFGDVGYKARMYNPSQFPLPTPTIDKLVGDGVALEQYYTNQLCSPTRTALLSGRYAYHLGMEGQVIVDGHPANLPFNATTIATRLKAQGWATAALGKWDAGMTSWGATPTCRGFDMFYGFYNADNDYFTHRVGTGLDFRQDFDPVFAANNESGVYMTELITRRVQQWITDVHTANASQPTFAYVAHQAVHAPNQVPDKYMTGECAGNVSATEHPVRLMLCGMIKAVDTSIAGVLATYERLGILNDTVIMLASDNGGNPDTGGSNYPLRGNKATLFEGGVRVVGAIAGAGLTDAVKGTVSHQLMHAVDWLPTIVEGIAGIPVTDTIDGVNQWQALTFGGPSARSEVLLELQRVTCKSANCTVPGMGAYRWHEWKLITGHTAVWKQPNNKTGAACVARSWDPPAKTSLPVAANQTTAWCANVRACGECCPPTPPARSLTPTCNHHGQGWTPPPSMHLPPRPPPDVGCTGVPCYFPNSVYDTGVTLLYNLTADPYETTDVSAQFPDVVALLMAKLQAYNATGIVQGNAKLDPLSNPALFGGVWTPWRGDPVPQHCSQNTTGGGAMHSAFDGLVGTAASPALQGWVWITAAPETVHVYDNDRLVASVVADVPRPGLVNKTGAPNANHGFTVPVNATVVDGDHQYSAAVAYHDGARGVVAVPLSGSPKCYRDGKPAAC